MTENLARLCWLAAAPLLLLTGLRCTLALRLVQFRHPLRCLRRALGVLRGGRGRAFDALCASLAGAAGTGNIAGVAAALAAGGPGALVWMSVSALIGTAPAYREAALCTSAGGSPMLALRDGLRSPAGAGFYAACLTGCALTMGGMVQTGAAAQALTAVWSVPGWLTGCVLAAAAAAVLIGGAKWLARAAGALTPLMSLLWVGLCCAVILSRPEGIGAAARAMLTSAAGFRSAAAGFSGFWLARAVRIGLSRGVFSNEAGLGSLGLVLASSEHRDPSDNGLLAALAVCVDTPILCSLTGLALLLCGTPASASPAEAFSAALGPVAGALTAVATVLFAFGTVMAWSYCGQRGFLWLFPAGLAPCYLLACCAAAVAGACLDSAAVWAAADLFNALLAFPNCALLWRFDRFPLPVPHGPPPRFQGKRKPGAVRRVG